MRCIFWDMTSLNGNIFHVIGPSWGESTGHRCSPVDSPHKGQWRGALMFSLICAWANGWANSWYACDLKRHRAQYDVIIIEGRKSSSIMHVWWQNSVRNFMVRTQYFQYCACYLGRSAEVRLFYRTKWWFSLLKHVYFSQHRPLDIVRCSASEAIELCWQGNHLEQPHGHHAKLLPTWQDNKTWAGFMAFYGMHMIALCQGNATECAQMCSKPVMLVM